MRDGSGGSYPPTPLTVFCPLLKIFVRRTMCEREESFRTPFNMGSSGGGEMESK